MRPSYDFICLMIMIDSSFCYHIVIVCYYIVITLLSFATIIVCYYTFTPCLALTRSATFKAHLGLKCRYKFCWRILRIQFPVRPSMPQKRVDQLAANIRHSLSRGRCSNGPTRTFKGTLNQLGATKLHEAVLARRSRLPTPLVTVLFSPQGAMTQLGKLLAKHQEDRI